MSNKSYGRQIPALLLPKGATPGARYTPPIDYQSQSSFDRPLLCTPDNDIDKTRKKRVLVKKNADLSV